MAGDRLEPEGPNRQQARPPLSRADGVQQVGLFSVQATTGVFEEEEEQDLSAEAPVRTAGGGAGGGPPSLRRPHPVASASSGSTTLVFHSASEDVSTSAA